ncbi:excinuclease ABC subunit UvrB [Salinivirga cyanobacteriivorans]
MQFKIKAPYIPTGDQPEAIEQLSNGVLEDTKHQTLLGVTGSGKTFSMANVIEKVQRPTLVLSHNKTLAAQLYSEFKSFFPDNAVEYFVSYYDYYQPEAYIPVTDTYIEKDLMINDEIEKLRLSTTSALLSGRRDVLVVSSVSCLYGIGNPDDFNENVINIHTGMEIARNKFLRDLVGSLYSRDDVNFNRGKFRVNGDTIDVWIAYGEVAFKIEFWGDEIDKITTFDPVTNEMLDEPEEATIYPANIFVTSPQRVKTAVQHIEQDMFKQVAYFKEIGKHLEAKRLQDRVTYDLEMIRELGHCPGIENYSRYFDGRAAGTRPFCLLDYFPDDYLVFIDESHVSIPQIKAMYGGDHSRKLTLVEHGFRLPAALDNRPLKIEEFESLVNQIVYVSATPADYELEKSEGIIAEQVIRPTGLLDPRIEVRPSGNQIDDLIEEVNDRAQRDERILVTTLTKRMAEELTKYFIKLQIKTRYIHSDIDTLERVEIMSDLRAGRFDVLVGVNLLREGLDLPEVSLVAILDADKEGFLRSERSLTQTAGRAARNVNGLVIMYADKITNSMQKTIDETERRRLKQINYNQEHGIIPQPLKKEQLETISDTLAKKGDGGPEKKAYIPPQEPMGEVAEKAYDYMTLPALEVAIKEAKQNMEKMAADLNFIEAARYRDEMQKLEDIHKKKKALQE